MPAGKITKEICKFWIFLGYCEKRTYQFILVLVRPSVIHPSYSYTYTYSRYFYELYDKGGGSQIPDLKAVIPEVKSKVLSGSSLVFSGLVPTHQRLESSRAYLVARSLGAEVTQDLTDNTTHLVAVRSGTSGLVCAGVDVKLFVIITLLFINKSVLLNRECSFFIFTHSTLTQRHFGILFVCYLPTTKIASRRSFIIS